MNQDIKHSKIDDLDVLDGKEIKSIYLSGRQLGSDESRNILITKVQHHEHNKRRAIKQVPIEHSKFLLRGLRILRSLDHPNIIKTYELFKDDSNYYLVMQYVPGGDLQQKIATQKIKEPVAARFMKQLLSVVQYLHKRGIVHRDLKPENIVCENDKISKEITNFKLIGFSSATRCPNDKFLTNIVGTVRYQYNQAYYMAPEVFKKQYNKKCDIWSCGIILYALLSQNVPFYGKSIEEVQEAINNNLLIFDDKFSSDAKDLISQLLMTDPQKRISAEDAIKHIFIQSNCQDNIDIKSLRNLKGFRGYSAIKTSMIQYIIDKQMTDEEKDHLTQQFNSIDKNGDGIIDRTELYNTYVKSMKPKEAQDKVDAIFKLADTDNSGELDHREFIMAASSQDTILNKVKLSQAFDSINSSSDTFLSKQELIDAFGEQQGKQSWRELREKYDTNKDGKINKAEFIDYFIK